MKSNSRNNGDNNLNPASRVDHGLAMAVLKQLQRENLTYNFYLNTACMQFERGRSL